MATESSIMDSNSFKEEYASMLSPKTREMISKREKYLGGAYRLFYRKPLNIVRGEGDYLWDDEGNKYLDMYNNVAGVGHCNPAVVNAVTEQMKTLNTHTRYLHEKILDYSEELLEHCKDVGGKLLKALKEVQKRHPESVGDVRGAGLFLGFEFVKNDGNKTPDKNMALNVIAMLRDEHILTSVIGHYGNILKLRPPMVFSENDIDWFATSLDKCITKLENK